MSRGVIFDSPAVVQTCGRAYIQRTSTAPYNGPGSYLLPEVDAVQKFTIDILKHFDQQMPTREGLDRLSPIASGQSHHFPPCHEYVLCELRTFFAKKQ